MNKSCGGYSSRLLCTLLYMRALHDVPESCTHIWWIKKTNNITPERLILLKRCGSVQLLVFKKLWAEDGAGFFSTQTKGEAQFTLSGTDSAGFLKWQRKVAEQQLSKKMAIKPPLSQYLCLTPILSTFPAGMFTPPAPREGVKDSEACWVRSGETPASSPGL